MRSIEVARNLSVNGVTNTLDEANHRTLWRLLAFKENFGEASTPHLSFFLSSAL